MRISGLGDGFHDFSFDLDEAFFGALEQSEIEKGLVRAGVVLEKKPGVFSLHFDLEGQVEVLCDRCLEPYMAGVGVKETLFVKMGDELREVEENILMIHKDDHEIEIGQLMYEYIVLALPYKRVHPPQADGMPGCNPEMLQRLEEHQGSEKESGDIDPRWEKLKGIIDKKK